MRHFKFFFLSSIVFSQFTIWSQVQCDSINAGLTPLIDFLPGQLYLGYEGGLYPGASNVMPAAHKNAGIQLSKSIKPLDINGNVDWENGKVLLVGMGASTAGNSWNHFIDLIPVEPGLNPCLKVVNACLGAKGMEVMNDTDQVLYSYAYWDTIFNKLEFYGVSPEQVQVAWAKTASKVDTVVIWPDQPDSISQKYEVLMRVLHSKFPNLKMVYLTGFFYGGYADPTKEFYDVVSEPGSYWNSFAVKWVVERQIEGDPGLKFTEPGKVAPWIAWGPYVWADGLTPNSEGLFWECEVDFAPDGGGYHLTNAGKDKEAERIFDFFEHNPTTRRWFMDNPKWSSCDPYGKTSDGKDLNTPEDNSWKSQDIQLYPSPNDGNFYVRFVKEHTGYARLKVTNNIGATVYHIEETTFAPNQGYSVNMQHAAPGIYHLEVNVDGQLLSKEFIVR
jgi:hypothetical protein